MTYRQLYKVRDRKLVITLPAAFKDKQVMVTVNDKTGIRDEKIARMKQAAKDPLYLSDPKEVNDDFT